MSTAATRTGPSGRSVSTRLPRPLVVLGLILYFIVGGLAAMLEVLLIPLRISTVLVPVTVVLAIVGNTVLPRLSRALTGSTAGAVPPLAAWVLVVAVASTNRPEGDVLLPGGGSVQYVSYGLMLLGLLSGVVAIALVSARGAAGGYDEAPSGSGARR
ncbi:MAG: hypothetical protein JWN95_1583 [Frankiales bacterium]|nr:hypothetical protein [Frankiales bacterium]